MFPVIGPPPGPATESHVVKRETPVAPRRVHGGLSGSPRIRAGTSKRQRSHARHPPLGQPQLNVPRKKSHPRGKPLQPRFPKEHHRRRAAGDSLCGTRPQSKHRRQPGNGEGRRGGGVGLGPPQRRRPAPPAFDTKRPGHSSGHFGAVCICG